VFSWKVEYRFADWCIKQSSRNSTINELIRDMVMPTDSNCTSSHAVLKMLNRMSYIIGIDYWKSGNLYSNSLADPNNLHHHDYTPWIYCNHIRCIHFVIQQPAFREYTTYAPAKQSNDAAERIHSDVKSSDWWWNELLGEFNFVISTIMLPAWIATVAA